MLSVNYGDKESQIDISFHQMKFPVRGMGYIQLAKEN